MHAIDEIIADVAKVHAACGERKPDIFVTSRRAWRWARWAEHCHRTAARQYVERHRRNGGSDDAGDRLVARIYEQRRAARPVGW